MKNKDTPIGVFKAYLTEIKDRWFSSKKRIIKTIGVLFIPFVYGFTCIAAFWNPLEKVGSVPIALCSLDKEQLITEDLDTTNINADKPIAIGIPKFYTTDATINDATDWSTIPTAALTSESNWDNLNSFLPSSSPAVTFIKTISGSILNYDHTTKINEQYNANGSARMLSLMDEVMKSWQNGKMVDGGFGYSTSNNNFSITGELAYPITNIKYHNVNNSDSLSNWDKNANDLAQWDINKKQWNIKNTSDYAQITIPERLTTDLVNVLDANIAGTDPDIWISDLENMPINLYVTYEKTYLASKLIDESIQTLTSLISGSLPMAGMSLVNSIINNLANNISTPVNDTGSEAWNGGYSWTPNTSITNLNLSWNDHSYAASDGGRETVSESCTVDLDNDKYYTLPNEEYRQALLNETSVPNSVKDQLKATRTDSSYVIPSIEGITVNDSGWNPSENVNGQKSLLHRIRNIASTFAEIPAISNLIADVINFYGNMNLDKIFSGLGDKILSIDVNASNVQTLFDNDQYLSSMLLQDSRYMIPDINAPSIPVVADLPIPIGGSINFGRIIAIMAHTGNPGNSSYSNAFQDANLRSLYSVNSSDFQTSDTSYHKGEIMDDILGPLTPLFNSNYDYAINTADIVSNDSPDGYSLSQNLLNNAQAIESKLIKIFSPFNVNSYVSYTTIGHEYDLYGMGLGEYFVCIGLCVGTLTQIMVYDKKKRVRRIRAAKWYTSKSLLMISTSLLQSTILALAIGCLGWFKLGDAFVLQWLFMMFCGLIFVSIIQAIWFCFRDRSLAFFVVVIFMVLNLAAGWGTFPSFMQFPFFHYISYILPFTYMIHGQGAIIFGIATHTHVLANSLYILQNIGILLIYVVVFYCLGCFMSRFRERELYYGTCNSKHLAIVLKQLGYGKYCYLSKHKKWKTNWKTIPRVEMPNVKNKVNLIYPFEKIIKNNKSPELIRDIVDFDNN